MRPSSQNLMYNFGVLIGRYPNRFLVASLAVCAILFTHFVVNPLTVDTDIRRGFAHHNGRSAIEYQIFGEFYNVSIKNMELILLIFEAKRPGDRMPLNVKLLNEIQRCDLYLKNIAVELDDTIEDSAGILFTAVSKNQTVSRVRHRPKLLRFGDIQTSRGNVNFLFDAFKWGLEVQEDNLQNGNYSLDDNIRLSFPTSQIYGHKFPTTAHFFDVQLYNDTSPHASDVESVGLVALWYMIQIENPKIRPFLQQIEVELYKTAEHDNFSELYSFYMYGDEVANYEMMNGSHRTSKLLAVGMLIMLLFMKFVLRDLDWKCQAVLLSSSVLSPIFAVLATISLMGWTGIQINSLMSIMPFLILGIGVDDAFLLIHTWRKLLLSHAADRDQPAAPVRQMAHLVAEVGPSICITSLTNMLAFFTGFFSPSSQLSIFCLSTSIAVFLDLIFQFTIFTPSLIIAERFVDSRKAGTASAFDKNNGKRAVSYFWRRYARFVVARRTSAVAALLLAALYVFAYFGCRRMEVSFEPQKTFPTDSRLQDSVRVINRILTQYSPVSFVVNRAPNILDKAELNEFFQLIHTLEQLPSTSTLELWLNNYLKYEKHRQLNKSAEGKKSNVNNDVGNSTVLESSSELDGLLNYGGGVSYDLVPDFLVDNLLDDKNVVLWHRDDEGRVVVDKFVFVLICYGERNWHDRAFFIDDIRAIADRYPRYNVTVFDYDATIFDLIITVKAEMLKSIFITLVCMSVVCFIIIASAKYTVVAILSVLSTSYTLLGALGWWDLDMDPVTLIAVLMAVGLSVDTTAHICYHYQLFDVIEKRKRRDKNGAADAPLLLRVASSPLQPIGEREDGTDEDPVAYRKSAIILDAVGKPMLEASISTVVCMLPLFFIPIYVVGSFAKTVVCVGMLSTLHGLFLVPILLSALNGLENRLGGRASVESRKTRKSNMTKLIRDPRRPQSADRESLTTVNIGGGGGVLSVVVSLDSGCPSTSSSGIGTNVSEE